MTASYGFDTLQIHAGARPDPATGARQTPIYQTTAYVFRDADHAAALFNLQEVGFIYSRLTNPTVAVLQERIATLEGGVGAVCCSSGHAAQIMALFPLMAPGRNIVASTRLYGGTVTQFSQTIKRFGWSALRRFRRSRRREGRDRRRHPRDLLRSHRQSRRLHHRLPAIAGSPTDAGLPLIVDNTSATPYLCRPIEHGATLVVHSTTKYLTGNGTVTGGAWSIRGASTGRPPTSSPRSARPSPPITG
jgi:O-acetylhomoserine (thiol)-lyase